MHQNFIIQAIESVLMQESEYPFELVIVNDCSSDHTEKMIERVINEHPKGGLINYFNHKKNIGMMANFGFALEKCRGKYIAFCEGDDYWSDKNKLQIQTDFLENNNDFTLVGYNACYNINGVESDQLVRNVRQTFIDFKTSELIKRNPFVTCGVMIKNIGFENIMSILNNFIVGDKAIFTFLSFTGKCRFYSQSMGFYRIHEHSVTSKNRLKYRPFRNEYINRIKHAEYWNDFSGKKYNEELNEVRQGRSKTLVGMALRNLDFKTAIYYSQFVNLEDFKKVRSKLIIKILKWTQKLTIPFN